MTSSQTDAVKRLGNKTRANPFDFVRPRLPAAQHRSLGLDSNAEVPGTFSFKIARHS